MTSDKGRARAFALLGLVMLLWAGNSIIGRAVRFDVPPLTLAFVRWAGACAILTPFALRRLRVDLPALRAGWKEVVLLGVLGVGAFNALLYSGLQYTTATNAMLLQAAIPALVVILNRLLFGAQAGAWQAAGTLASIAGVVVIVFEGDPQAALGLRLGPGDALILAAVIAWSLYTVFLRLRPAIAPISFIYATFAVGVVTMAPLALAEWLSGEVVRWSWPVAGAFAYVAVLPSIVAYFIYNWAAQSVGPARAGQAITLMPVFGALLSALLLGEALYRHHAGGMALIGVGIALGALALARESRVAKAAPPG